MAIRECRLCGGEYVALKGAGTSWECGVRCRFLWKVDARSDCWEWLGVRQNSGYGLMRVDARSHWLAHRLSWEVFHGKIPEGMLVLHHCDNRGCVNPEHIFLGDYRDNARDMVRKGRHVRSELAGRRLEHAREDPLKEGRDRLLECKYGHPWSVFARWDHLRRRYCGECKKQYHAALYRRKKGNYNAAMTKEFNGPLSGTVELDECFIGPKPVFQHADKRKPVRRTSKKNYRG